MGYESTLYGEIAIVPPLRWAQIQNHPHYGRQRAQSHHLCVYLVGREDVVETDDGPLTKRTAYAIAFAWDRAVKIYEVVDEVQRLVDAFPDHEFRGEFRGVGTDFGDIWLLRVDTDRKVQRILPVITWPDGTVLRNERY